MKRLIYKRIVVHLKSGKTFTGLCAKSTRRFVFLKDAKIVTADGELAVDDPIFLLSEIEWMQYAV